MSAISQLKTALGEAKVLTATDRIQDRRHDYWVVSHIRDRLGAQGPAPDCVVRPASVADVQAVVRTATATGTPLIPFGLGSGVPRRPTLAACAAVHPPPAAHHHCPASTPQPRPRACSPAMGNGREEDEYPGARRGGWRAGGAGTGGAACTFAGDWRHGGVGPPPGLHRTALAGDDGSCRPQAALRRHQPHPAAAGGATRWRRARPVWPRGPGGAVGLPSLLFRRR